MTEEHDDLTPFLAAKGLTEERIAEFRIPDELYHRLSETIGELPRPTAGEDAQDWWSRVRKERADQRRAGRKTSNVVSLADWKARNRTALVLKAYSELIFGDTLLEVPHLPGEIITADGALTVYFEAVDGTIKVELETNNLFALEFYSGDQAFQIAFGDLDRAPLIIETPVTFDKQGLATIFIADTPATRRQLGRTNVFEIVQ